MRGPTLPTCPFLGPVEDDQPHPTRVLPPDYEAQPFKYLPPKMILSAEELELAARYEKGDFSGGYLTSQIARFRRGPSPEEHQNRRGKFQHLKAAVDRCGLVLPEAFIELVESDDYVNRLRHNCIWIQLLEDRLVPASFVWTDASGDGMAGTAANWYDPVGKTNAVPGSGDYVLFGDAGTGSSASCMVNIASWGGDRALMDSSYAGALFLPSGNKITTANQFVQYGDLVLGDMGPAEAEIDAGTFFDAYGAITHGGGAGPALLHTGSFFLSGGTITDTSAADEGLEIDGAFDDAGIINVGYAPAGASGYVTIDGTFVEDSGGAIDVASVDTTSTLTFTEADPDLKGTNVLDGEIDSDTTIAIDSGTLACPMGAAGIISGDVGIYNGGVVTVVGTAGLTSTSGNFIIGALEDGLTPTGGTVDLVAGSALMFPAAAASSVIVTPGGVLDMEDGATITMSATRVTKLELQAPEPGYAAGTLNSLAAAGAVNTIAGTVDNEGLVSFGGAALNTLDLFGDYTQGSSGTLYMRLDNGGGGVGVNDALAVGTGPGTGTCTLDGTLTLRELDPLTPAQTFTLITAGNTVLGDFANINWPDSSPNWVGPGPNANPYAVVGP